MLINSDDAHSFLYDNSSPFLCDLKTDRDYNEILAVCHKYRICVYGDRTNFYRIFHKLDIRISLIRNSTVILSLCCLANLWNCTYLKTY